MSNGQDGTSNEALNGEAKGPAAPSGWLRGKDAGPRVALVVFVALLTAGLFVYVRWLSIHPLPDAVAEASGWVQTLANGNLSALAIVLGPLVALCLLVIGLLVHFGMPRVWQSARRSLQLGALLGACLAGAWFIGTARLTGLRNLNWLFFVPIVPPALLAFQAMITWRQRPRSVGDFRIGVSKELRKALEESGDVDRFEEVHAQVARIFGGAPLGPARLLTPAEPGQQVEEPSPRYGAHNPTSFAAQFAVPGLLLLLVGFGALSLTIPPPPVTCRDASLGAAILACHPAALPGLRWGVAGAYTYVLFTFGSRSFRNDLTVGAATWAIVTLITGPTLAVVLALAWNINPAAAGDTAWQSAAVLFFAGLAPRRVMTVIERVALQFLKSPSDASTPKLIPLTSLRGISAELAVRLREENIEDVTALAYADPIRLVQAMPYDLRQVVEWIDEAQLAVALPAQYETLLERGVTGAIDLAWRWLQACFDPQTGEFKIRHASTPPQSFVALVREARDAELVYDSGRQMFYEEQVRLLWVMYNCFSTSASDQSPVRPASDSAPPELPPKPPTNGARPASAEAASAPLGSAQLGGTRPGAPNAPAPPS